VNRCICILQYDFLYNCDLNQAENEQSPTLIDLEILVVTSTTGGALRKRNRRIYGCIRHLTSAAGIK